MCTDTSYASSAVNPQMLNYAYEARTIAAACGTTPTTANTVSDKITLYDLNSSGASLDNNGQALGEATTQQVLDHYDAAKAPVYATISTASFDRYGRPLTTTDPNATDVYHPAGAVTSTSYDPQTGAIPTQVTVTNPLGFTTATTMDPGRSQPVHIVDRNNAVTDITYDALGRIAQVWSPIRAKATYPTTPSMQFAYSVNGMASPSWTETLTLRDDGSTYAVSYSLLDGFAEERQSQADALDASGGRVITDTFRDTHGKVVKQSSPYFNSSAPSSAIYSVNDNTVPGQTVTAYDGQGRVTATTFDSYANPQWTTTTAYPGADRTDVTAPTGTAPTSTFKDGRGHVTALWRYKTATPTGNVNDADTVSYTYTPAGLQASVTDATNATSWSYGYDLRGRKTSSQHPDSGLTTTGYDVDSRVATSTNALGKQLTYGYDLLGRKTAEYDTTGNAAPSGADQLAAWTYDTVAKGEPASAIRYVGGTSGNAYKTSTTGYTADYKPTGTSISIPGIEGVLAGTYTTTMGYRANTELLAEVDEPGAGNLYADSLFYNYQPFGLEMSVGGNGDYVTGVTYDPFGKPQRTTLGDMPLQAVQTTGYDTATNRPMWVNVDKENDTASVDATTYTYSTAGQITSARDKQDSGGTDLQCYTYDYAGRLTGAWSDTGGITTAVSPSVPNIGGCSNSAPTAASAAGQVGGPAAYWQTYVCDITDDRKTETDHDTGGNIAADINRTYNYPAPGTTTQPHTLTSTTVSGSTTGDSYGYDKAGDTISRKLASGTNQTLSWDPEGHLQSVTDNNTNKTSSYLYDADGGLLIQRDPSETVLYLGGEEVHLVGGVATGIRGITAPGGPTVEVTANAVTYKFANLQNTADVTIAAATLSTSRRHFDPYGRPRGTAPASWPDEHAFLDKPADPSTGLDLVGARAYDGGSGRFVSADPVFEVGDQNQMGGYTYAGGDPVNAADPTGRTIVDALCDGEQGCTKNTLGVDPSGGSSGGGSGSGSGGDSGGSGTGSSEDTCYDGSDQYCVEQAFLAYSGDSHSNNTEGFWDVSSAPGNGIITTRFFIADGMLDGIGHGDSRGFSNAPMASSRFTVAWDTDTGTLYMVDQPSCIVGDCVHAHDIGGYNNLTNVKSSTSADGSTSVSMSYLGSDAVVGGPQVLGKIAGNLTMTVHPDGDVSIKIQGGTTYPSVESYQYQRATPTKTELQDQQQPHGLFASWFGPMAGLREHDRNLSYTNGVPDSGPLWAGSPTGWINGSTLGVTIDGRPL